MSINPSTLAIIAANATVNYVSAILGKDFLPGLTWYLFVCWMVVCVSGIIAKYLLLFSGFIIIILNFPMS